jgi:phage terminase large subunit-like protein
VSKKTPDQPEFNDLSPAEQKAVAERLLRIKESGWKPFWCANPTCTGDPHWAEDEDGNNTFVSISEIAGPNGEPLGPVVYEDSDGEWYIPESGVPDDGDTPVGRPVLVPKWAHNHARVDQRLPPWMEAWILFIMSGRGAGKTRTGVEFVTLSARKGLDGAILGRRGTELVNTHVAEIIAHAHPDFMPTHWASKDILEWPNGAITYLFSAEKPENIRSVNLSYAWVDEAAFMDEIETAWMNLTLAVRVKKENNPLHILVTSTPTGTKWVMDMEDDPDVTVRRVSTYANRANLDSDFLTKLEKKYEGTRMGRQELHGEVLRDVEGALWNDDLFNHVKLLDTQAFDDYLESLDDRVVAVDPAGSKGKRSDQTGIIAVGAHHFDDDGNRLTRSRLAVIGRATLTGSPTEWARATYRLARYVRANRIVAEKNFGGDMVKQVLSDFAALNPAEATDENGEHFRIEVVHAVKSKETRAEALVGKYEQGTVDHIIVPGVAMNDLSELEKQQVTWVPKSRGGRMPSPNDIDALVWAARAVEKSLATPAVMATSRNIMGRIKNRGTGPRMAMPAGGTGRGKIMLNTGPVGPRGRNPVAFPVKKKPAA